MSRLFFTAVHSFQPPATLKRSISARDQTASHLTERKGGGGRGGGTGCQRYEGRGEEPGRRVWRCRWKFLHIWSAFICFVLSSHKNFVNGTHKSQPQESIEMFSCADCEVWLKIEDVILHANSITATRVAAHFRPHELKLLWTSFPDCKSLAVFPWLLELRKNKYFAMTSRWWIAIFKKELLNMAERFWRSNVLIYQTHPCRGISLKCHGNSFILCLQT